WSKKGLEDLGGAFALGLGRHERHPHITLAVGAEEAARSDEDPGVQQAAREELRRPADPEPEEEGGVAARELQPLALEDRQERVALPPVEGSDLLDVAFVGQCGHAGPLDELLRRRPGRRTEGT